MLSHLALHTTDDPKFKRIEQVLALARPPFIDLIALMQAHPTHDFGEGTFYVGNPLKSWMGYKGSEALHVVSFSKCCWEDAVTTPGSFQGAVGLLIVDKMRIGRYNADEILEFLNTTTEGLPQPTEVTLEKKKRYVITTLAGWGDGINVLHGAPLLMQLDKPKGTFDDEKKTPYDIQPLVSGSLLSPFTEAATAPLPVPAEIIPKIRKCVGL